MFKKYMCLALCLLMALGTMSTTASAASSADALVASYVSFSDSTGVISDLPESESTVTASVAVSNNSSRASSVVLWVGKFVDDVLTDVTYQQQDIAGNAQDVTVSASLDGVKKDLATAADGSSYDRTVVKAFVWTALVGGKALAPVASLPSDNLDVVAVKKDGDVWKDFNSATTNYDLTITKTDPIPEFEFIVADNSTKVEMPDEFVIGSNTVKLTSAAGTEKEYTINLIDGYTTANGIFSDDFESYSGAMDAHIWTTASGYLDNMSLIDEGDGNTYVSIFGTADQQWPRLDTTLTGLDLSRVIEISGRGMLQDGTSHPTFTLEIRRDKDNKTTAFGVSNSGVSLFGQSFGGGVNFDTWFEYTLLMSYDETTKNATITATITGDGLKDSSGSLVPSLTSTRTGSLSVLNLNNDLPLMFNTGGLNADGTGSVNFDDIKVAYGSSNDATLQTLQYTADGVTRDVTDFVPGAAAPADGYRIYVPEGTPSVTLKAVPTIAQGAKAEVYVDGALSADNSVAIAGEETAATIRVTAENGTTTADYPITIVIGDAVASTNIKLATLTYAINGEDPVTVSGFTPVDEGGNYNVILPNGTTSVTLAAAPANANATYTMALADGTPVENGVVDVTNGATVVITVTPEDTGAAKGVFTINFAIDQGMYVLDENNGAVQSENSGIEFTTAVLESGSATYDYADGFVIGGVGSSGNRNSDYVLNGDGKNLGYTWTLSSDEYMPGTYNVYVKGSGYGSNSKDSFYFVYDEAACSPDSGLMFLAPAQSVSPVAEQAMVALNWVEGDNTITIPEDGSATLRILGREGGAFVDKVILIDTNVAKTIEEAEAEMSPLYDAVFTSEGGDTLATVKYGSDVVGTAVPTEGTYLDEDSIPATGTIDALVVPEKEGFAGSWSPAVLQDGGTTFVPVYEEPVDLIFEDDFEGYGDLTVPDNSKWDGIYKFNTLLKKDGSNTYASLFPAIREDLTPPSFERYPRLSESFAFDATKGALRFSGRVMLQDNIAKTEFGLHLLGTGNSRGYPMSLSASQIKVFGVEESFGQMPTGNWVDFTYYLTYDSNSKNAEGLMILEGEGLTDAFGNTTNRIVAAGATDLSAVGITDKLTVYFNTTFSAEDSGASVNFDDIEIGYANAPTLSDNATLSSLTYAVDGGAAETVPGFTANADPDADGYSITLPEGTTSVTISGAVADVNASGSILIDGVASEDGTIAVEDGSVVTAVYRVIAENGKMNQYVVNITVEGVMADRVTNMSTAATAGVYTENGGYTTEQVPSISGKYAVTDGLIPGTTSRYTSESTANPRAVSANTNSYFNSATVIRGDRNDRTASPGGNWSNRPYYVGTSGNPDAYNGKDDNGYWLEFTVTSACTVFQTLTGPVNTGGVWPNAPEAPEEWTKNTKANFLLDASSDFYYRHYEAGETVRIPNFGKIGTWVSGEGGTAWYEAPTWFIVWDSTGKVNPAEASDVAKLSSLQYTVADGVATDVPGFDAAAEGGSYNLTLGEGTTSVTITAATQKNGTATVMVDNEAVAGGVIDLTEGAATVKVVVSSESGLVSNAFTINITVEGAEIVNQILNLTEAEPNASTDLQMKADTIVFGTTSPYLLYSVGEANNADGTNTGAAIYGASNSPEFFEGATAIRRNKGDAFGSNNTDAPTAKYWGNPAYSGKDDNGYYLTFEVSSDATVYVVDREGKGWPNKPDDWQTSKYKFGSAGNMTMFYKTFTAGETVQIPNYGWNNSWTALTSDRAFKDPSFYVVVWGESPETAEPEPEPEPTEVIFEDDFEGYDVNTPISNTVKGWDAIYDNSASFIAVANPDGGQMAQAKALTKMVDDDEDPATPEVDKGQKYPVMHKNVNNIQETLSASEMEAIAIGGKVQIHNTADTKPSHYIELRNTANNDTSKRLTTLSITTDSISFFGTKEVPNVIGSATPDTWIDYTVYIVPGASGEETQFTVVLTGEGLKDADGTPTDRIVATKSQVYNVIADDNAVRVLYNNNIARDDGSYVNLDDLKIFATNVPEIEPEPEENAKLSALTYTVDSTTTSVPGFSATDEGGEYAAIELPYGTTSVTVGATRADDNASVTISPENPIAVSSAAETVVTVMVTNGDTTNTFKLTFTVAAQEPQPTEEIFSDDFEAYGLDTALDKATKGWDAVNQTANFTAVTNPAGNGQVAEVKWSADAPQETYPSLRKNVGMQAGETYAISGKVRIADAVDRKPSHYVEFRTTPAGGEEIRQITLRINNGMISLLDGNVIGSTPSESTWISYTLYVTPGVAETKIVAEVTGEGLKDVNGNDTDKVVAGITLQRPNFVPESGTQTVVTIFNNNMGTESDARIYLDDIVISRGATAPTLSSDTNLSSLKYAPNGSNATDVPGFAEDKTDYGTIELPYGTASVTVTAVTKDANARTSVMVGEDVMAGGVVTVSSDTATDVVVVVTAQDGTKREITMSFTVAEEEEPEPEPTEIISDLTYATSNTPTLTQIERGVTESYKNADGCVIGAASSAEFEGAYVLQRNKGADTPTPSSTAPYYAGAYDGQGDNPYWMTFKMNVAGTVYVADMEGKGWKNRGDWSVDTSGLTFGIWAMTINGSSGRLFSKHFNAGDTVQVPNYGWDESWGDATKRIFTNPSIYLIVPDSNLTKSASLKSLTYTVGDGSAFTVPDFVSGSTATNTFDVTISDMSAAVKVAAEGITNANASISYSDNVDTDGTVTFVENEAQVVVTVKSADGSVTNTYTINFTRNVDPMAGAKTYDVPSHEGTTIDILVNPELTALRSNSGNNEIKPTEPIGNLSKFYGDRGDTGVDGKTPGMAFIDVGAAIMGATQLINPLGDTRSTNTSIQAFIREDNEYFRFRANEAGTVYVKYDRDIASYDADPTWKKVVEPSNGLAGMSGWGADGLPEEYVHNYAQYPYYCNMYQNASADKDSAGNPAPKNYATRYTVTYYKSFAANEVVTIRTINSTNNQNLITLIQWGEDVPSYNTALASLTYNGISVPNFSADTKDYTIYMPTADAVSIAAVAAESGMNVSYSKQSLTPSAAGDTATITVSNSEGTQTVYTVKAILDATANKVLNLSSASRADVQENLVIGASDGAGGSLAYIDRDNVLYTDGTSTFFEGATYIRSAKDDGNAVYSTKPYFSETYNGKDGNPYWLEFVVSSDCRIFFADTYYNADLTNEGLGMQEFAQPWPNKPEGWITAAPTDDVDIVSTHFQAKTENGSVYYKDFKAGDVVQIPNYGAPSYWADDRAPWDPPVYLIVWGSDIKNPGIDDGGDVGGDTGDEGGIEEGGQDPNPWQ